MNDVAETFALEPNRELIPELGRAPAETKEHVRSIVE